MKSKLNLITEEIKEKAIKNEIEDENFLYYIWNNYVIKFYYNNINKSYGSRS
jgi:hypothetical protein